MSHAGATLVAPVESGSPYRSSELPVRQTTRVRPVCGTLARISSSISILSLSARKESGRPGRVTWCYRKRSECDRQGWLFSGYFPQRDNDRHLTARRLYHTFGPSAAGASRTGFAHDYPSEYNFLIFAWNPACRGVRIAAWLRRQPSSILPKPPACGFTK
jgi:hypothetical protein